MWLSTHYGVGEEWGIVDGDVVAAERHIASFVERPAARRDYPYDIAVVHAANDELRPVQPVQREVGHCFRITER